MRIFENTKEDKELLQEILATGVFPKAKFSLGCFTSDLASSLTIIDHIGYVTELDMRSGYCNWTHENGYKMPCVNIDCITLID